MRDSNRCADCGAPLRDGAMECLSCLLRLGIETNTRSPFDVGSVLFQRISTEAIAGLTFGDYELVESIGRGGMGVVLMAKQRSCNRLVALKLLLPNSSPFDDSVERFRIETEAAASLDHPNIVTVFDADEYEGISFIAMKLIAGGNLGQRLAQVFPEATGERIVPRSPRSRQMQRDVAALVEKIAWAVAHAHQRGVLHRDLKPSNILLDSAGEPHVTDFGLAKFMNRATDLTVGNALAGSIFYMAPEQASGDRRNVSVAADIYGIGAILYEIITRRPPFYAVTVTETLQHVLEDTPQKP